jgi:ketosteroid isomerase-like protein
MEVNMSRFLSRSLVLVIGVHLVALAAVSAGSAAPTPTEKEVRARRAAFLKAILARKPDEVTKFLADSLTLVAQGRTVTGEEAKTAFAALTTLPAKITITSKIEKVEVRSDTAVITVTDTVSGTGPDGQKVKQTGRSRETWKKTGGRWLLVKNEVL